MKRPTSPRRRNPLTSGVVCEAVDYPTVIERLKIAEHKAEAEGAYVRSNTLWLAQEAIRLLMEERAAGRLMLPALKRSLRLVEKQDADSGCMAFTEMARDHRAAIAAAEKAGIGK